jgi:hypothetical protein
MTGRPSARLVTNCQPLATPAPQLSAPRLTFVIGQGLTLDGHGRSMAETRDSIGIRGWPWRGESGSAIPETGTTQRWRFSGSRRR